MFAVVPVVITVVNEIQVGISKVEQIIRIVYGQAIGPVELIGDDGGPLLAVHAGSLNARVPSPVCPEHKVKTETYRNAKN